MGAGAVLTPTRFLYKPRGGWVRRPAVSPLRLALAPVVLAVGLVGCVRASRSEVDTATGAAAPAPSQAAPPPPPAGPSTVDEAFLTRAVPVLQRLSAPARREVTTALNDEFCTCGCPHTLAACLREHGGCRHAKRTAWLAAALANQGASSADISGMLGKYYAGFSAPRAALQVDPRMCQGREDAPVTMVVFSDFECPYCAQSRPVLEAVVRTRPGKVRLCALPFPLARHPNAGPAAQATLWARDQGKFWELHDALFENQADLGPAALPRIAASVGLDGKKLMEVLKAGTYAQEVEALRAQGVAAGLPGTPSVYLEGRLHTLGLSEPELRHSIDDEVEWKGAGGAWAKDEG